ncbi:FAD-dependent monooxygenase [Nonomuraea sp. K274]|uniref:FAD-dependent monooxygenase n=1 Tax=Nonomuraea cypriaca TaxID=1187855 RepID=A0A931AHT8_9ACTN|nr:NAD(P)/FAD-dependent oxidoreductase [Nonomuraea cypriaca]MBF8191910.1 FAD-dependent monooxygenase [Nonomuraea cypriaca]
MTTGNALVIGGGIAGPVLGLALRRAGIEATVYEAYAGPAEGVGSVLTIAPNGFAALGITGLDTTVRRIGQPTRRMVVANGRGRELGELPGLPGLEASQTMWRSDLYGPLHDHAIAGGVPIVYGKRLVGADETPGGITARFADGTTASGDVLIGADGIRSTVRTLIDPGAPGPRHVPLMNFDGLADHAVAADPDDLWMAFGRRGFLGYWLQPDGRTGWFANLPHAQPMTAAQARRVPAAEWLRRLREVYAGEVPATDLLRHTSPDRLIVLGTVEIMPSVPRWHRGRMVLVGDAVHAPSPSSGQGASLAIESAVQLARCLRDLPDPTRAFAAYERLRRPRVERVIRQAGRTNSGKLLGPVGGALLSLLLPLALRTALRPERTLGYQHRHRIDWDEAVGADAGPLSGARTR